MARNHKPEYLKKLAAINVNGYKIDVANYLYNPSYGHKYPSLCKEIEKTETETTFETVRYFKFYNGAGEYQIERATFPNSEGNVWKISRKVNATTIEHSNRFSLPRLMELAAARA